MSIYDEYISSYKDRSAMAEAEVAARLSNMGNALTYIIVIDGQVVGSWRRTFRGGSVVIETNVFTPLAEEEKQAITLAAR